MPLCGFDQWPENQQPEHGGRDDEDGKARAVRDKEVGRMQVPSVPYVATQNAASRRSVTAMASRPFRGDASGAPLLDGSRPCHDGGIPAVLTGCSVVEADPLPGTEHPEARAVEPREMAEDREPVGRPKHAPAHLGVP